LTATAAGHSKALRAKENMTFSFLDLSASPPVEPKLLSPFHPHSW
jgi:hypothetical protein